MRDKLELFPKNGAVGNFTKQNSGRDYLGQVFKVDITVDKPYAEYIPLDMRSKTFTSVIVFPNTHPLRLPIAPV